MKQIGRLELTILYTGGRGGIVTKSCQTLVTPWTVACRAPLSVGISRQEYWSGLPFPSPGDLLIPVIELEMSELRGRVVSICKITQGYGSVIVCSH